MGNDEFRRFFGRSTWGASFGRKAVEPRSIWLQLGSFATDSTRMGHSIPCAWSVMGVSPGAGETHPAQAQGAGRRCGEPLRMHTSCPFLEDLERTRVLPLLGALCVAKYACVKSMEFWDGFQGKPTGN